MAFLGMWRGHSDALNTRQYFELFKWFDLTYLKRERLCEQVVGVRIAKGFEQSPKARRTEDTKRFVSRLSDGCMFRPEQERSEPASVIEMKMRDPDRVEIRPVEILLCSTMDRRRRTVEEDRTALRLKPISRAASAWVWDRCT